MSSRPLLSRSAAGILWLRQFAEFDQAAAAEFADALILLNEADVADAIRSEIGALALSKPRRTRVAAVYPEREFGTRVIFESSRLPGRDGTIRLRAFGKTGPAAVVGRRGSTRVGSEGSMASIVSQAVDARKARLVNRPGPDRIRSRGVDLIIIATDFIGTGDRVVSMMDKFLRTRSVRAWRSNHWLDFAVVAAAGTATGIARIEAHRCRPRVRVTTVAPTLDSYPDRAKARIWRSLALHNGPQYDRGAGPLGYKESATLIAFSYRSPNNTPLLFHSSQGGWTPLFRGAASHEQRTAFGLPDLDDRLWAGVEPAIREASDLLSPEAVMSVVLRGIVGRWRDLDAVGLAERTRLTVPEITDSIGKARTLGLLDGDGRLTDEGHALLGDTGLRKPRDKTVPTRDQPYYPLILRAPR